MIGIAGFFVLIIIAGALVTVTSLRSAWLQSHLTPQLTGLVKDRVAAGVDAVRPLMAPPKTPAEQFDSALRNGLDNNGQALSM